MRRKEKERRLYGREMHKQQSNRLKKRNKQRKNTKIKAPKNKTKNRERRRETKKERTSFYQKGRRKDCSRKEINKESVREYARKLGVSDG